jgi:uncharacterized membrane protein YedE/YeeE
MTIATLFPAGWAHYLIGGLVIGSGVAVLFITTGLIGGMSSVFSSTWSYFSRAPFFQQARFTGSRDWRLVLAVGLVVGALAWRLWTPTVGAIPTTIPWWRLLAGGLLVGYGARRSNGCTSGHGICGLASLQLPSLTAVLIFLTTGMITAQLAFRIWKQ